MKIRENFSDHKTRVERHEGDRFPGENRPDIDIIREELCLKYNNSVNDKTYEQRSARLGLESRDRDRD